MILWEDNNNDNDVSNVRANRDSRVRATVRGGKRGERGDGGVRREYAAMLRPPVVLMAQAFATLAGFVAGFWLLMMALNVALDTPQDHAEPRSAAAFGWEVAR